MLALRRQSMTCYLSGLNLALTLLLAVAIFLLSTADSTGQQINSTPISKPAEKTVVIPKKTADDTPVRIEQPSGKISVANDIPDDQLQRVLNSIINRYPGAENARVQVSAGVATLNGRVRSDEIVASLGEFVRQVDGVRLVLNELESLEEQESPVARLKYQWVMMFRWLRRWWLSLVVALLIISLCLLINGFIRRYGQSLMVDDKPISLSKTLVLSIMSRIVPLFGFFVAILLMDWGNSFFSFFGAAGILGISFGFAFQQVGDNFLSSLLLGMRRPYKVGDYVEIAGYQGFVKSLNTRATNLVTLDSHLVRIPNSLVYKSLLVNQTASPIRREIIELKITSYKAALSKAQSLMTSVMMRHPAVLSNPMPRVLIEGLLPDGICLKAYYWIASVDVDRWLLASELRLAFKVELSEAGIPLDGSAGVTSVSVSIEPKPAEEIKPLDELKPGEMKPERPRDPDCHALEQIAQSTEVLRDRTSEFIQHQVQMLEDRETFLSKDRVSKS